MKRLKSLFLVVVRREQLLSTVKKFLLCLLIPVGIPLIVGCGLDKICCDTEDLSKEILIICEIEPASLTLDVEKVTTLMAVVAYSGDCRDLSYDWWTNGGRVDSNGKSATYVAPKTLDTYTITFEVSNGPITRTKTITVEVGKSSDPTQPPNNVANTGANGNVANTGTNNNSKN